MARPQYLTGSGKDERLRRTIPQALRPLLGGKTQLVERVGNLPAHKKRLRAHEFAVRTDKLFEQLRSSEANGSSEDAASAASAQTIRRAATALFLREEERREVAGTNHVPSDPEEAGNVLDAAVADASAAAEEAAGERLPFDSRLASFLKEAGIVGAASFERLTKGTRARSWPTSITDDPSVIEAARTLAQVELELAERRVARLSGRTVPPLPEGSFISRYAPEAGRAQMSIEQFTADYLGYRAKHLRKSRLVQLRLPLRALGEWMGATTLLSELSQAALRPLIEFLPRIPAHATKRYGDVLLLVAAEKYEQATGTPADRFSEARKHLNVLKGAFDYAMSEGWMDKNPAVGQEHRLKAPPGNVKKAALSDAGAHPFSADQLTKVFALPLFLGCKNDGHGSNSVGQNLIRRHRYWAPLIALWSGMRCGEILQLEKTDIGFEDGVHFFRVTDETTIQAPDLDRDWKRLKTRGSNRRVPVHPILLTLRFVEWVQSRPDGRLFPDAALSANGKLSDNFSKLFATNLKQAGVWEHRRFVFHSFRGTFADGLRRSAAPSDIVDSLLGWSERRSMGKVYGDGYSLAQLAECVSHVTYPAFDTKMLLVAADRYPIRNDQNFHARKRRRPPSMPKAENF